MKMLDKLKNALFEVEYVEVPNKPDKEEKKKEKEEKPIAKKIVSNRREDRHKDKDFDSDFEPVRATLDDNKEEVVEQPRGRREQLNQDSYNMVNDYVDEIEKDIEDDFYNNNPYDNDSYDNGFREAERVQPKEEVIDRYDYIRKNENVIYKNDRTPYGIDETNKNLVPEYGKGAYQASTEKVSFTPSPIISPIYGVLDKNYRKEDVVSKREVKSNVSSSSNAYSRPKEKLNVDQIRNKAYGAVKEVKKEVEVTRTPKTRLPIVEEDDDDLLIDLSRESDKPEVKEVTMGDAFEYYNDLGLEYNVDYVDANKKNTTVGRRSSNNRYDSEDAFSLNDDDGFGLMDSLKEDTPRRRSEILPKSSVEPEELDDNLFELIDSMGNDY